MIRAILHPTDLSIGGDAAFLHALRIAVNAKGELTILHSDPRPAEGDADWHSFPGVRTALSNWQLIEEDASQSAVEPKLGLRINKAELYDPSPIGSVVRWLDAHPCDLVVMATHARDGVDRWLHGSVAADLARQAPIPTLFLPIACRGFVDPASGAARIRNVLIPVDRTPQPGAAISLALELADLTGGHDATFHLLHVGPVEETPTVAVDPRKDRRFRRHTRNGPITDGILAVAEELQPELIVMPTYGRHGFLDALRGSTTERILRQGRRPLLAVPARL